MNKKSTKEEGMEAAHHVNDDTEQPALMVAQAEYDKRAWVLDTGSTNHMTGCRASLATLDKTVCGAVRFGDGSMVEICGVGAVMIAGRN